MEKFQKKTLNKEDHKKIDKTAKKVQIGTAVVTGLSALGLLAWNIVKAVIKKD